MTTIVLAEKAVTKMEIIPIDELKPHEKGSPLYLSSLKQELLRDGMIRYPIIADEETHVILDGMHRWLALKSLGYTLIPVLLVSRSQHPRIRIGKRRIHRYVNDLAKQMTIEEVIAAGLKGHLMNPRSTRHFFPFSKFQQINYPLHLLNRRIPQDVSKYLARMAKDECRLALKDWLEEIAEELDFLAKRRKEVETEMAEFLNRVRNLDSSLLTF